MNVAWRFSGLLAILLLALGAESFADIRETPHSMGAKGAADKDEQAVCLFCHTPTVDLSKLPSGVAVVPLWQSAKGAQSFVMFDDIGRAGRGDTSTVGSQSVACLSCHDGNQALSVSKLSSDHPYGTPYRGYTKGQIAQMNKKGFDSDEAGVTAKYLIALDEFREPTKGMVDNRTVWWVSASGQAGRRSRDDLPLYVRSTGGGDAVPHIECSSCHNPHSSAKLFLRGNTAGSALCLTCHVK